MNDPRKERMLNRLRAGAITYECGGFLAGLHPLARSEVYTSLLFDRLQRKLRTVEGLHAEEQEWNQTFYQMYFRTLGDQLNQQTYLLLAQRVPYKYILKERLTPQAAEAMLFGASGLLELYRHDAYTLDLRRAFEHFAAKYRIEPLDASAWELHGIRPANHPVLRIAQAARFFSQDALIMERAMACRREEDVQQLFCVEASDYWRTHHIPGVTGDEQVKRIGRFKADLIGINLVAVMQFAYGSALGRESLRDSALTLLERLPAEDNRYIRGWKGSGAEPRNAFESQALLQLATEYCTADRCEECPVGCRILQSLDTE